MFFSFKLQLFVIYLLLTPKIWLKIYNKKYIVLTGLMCWNQANKSCCMKLGHVARIHHFDACNVRFQFAAYSGINRSRVWFTRQFTRRGNKISFPQLTTILRSKHHVMDIYSRTTIKQLHLVRGGVSIRNWGSLKTWSNFQCLSWLLPLLLQAWNAVSQRLV